MYYTEWVEKVWRAIGTVAEEGPHGRTWSPLVSDRMLEALGVGISDMNTLPSEKQQELLWGIDQAGVLLNEKGLYQLQSGGRVEITQKGHRLVGKSPVLQWPSLEFAAHQVTFLSRIAQKQVVTGLGDAYMYVPHNPPSAAKTLFKELNWTYTPEDFDTVSGRLVGHELITRLDTGGDHKLRLTPKGALYAARLAQVSAAGTE